MKILAIEPWFGETHRLFLENWAKYSRHEIQLITLPARKWKWRMLAGNLLIIEQIKKSTKNFEAILVSDYVNLPELIGLQPDLFAGKFICSYFHENQLTYPVQKQSDRDYAFALANIMTLVASDQIIWNSQFHMNDFLEALPSIIKICPDPKPANLESTTRQKSLFIPVGLEFEEIDKARENRQIKESRPLRILWPHRWEHDKNPEQFFNTLFELKKENLPFELTVLGKSYIDIPPIFNEAKEILSENIVQFEYVDTNEYFRMTANCDVVVSTAWHENQGIAVIEAIRAGCVPLLPNRLAYPEAISPELHDKYLYNSPGELRRKLRWMIKNTEKIRFKTYEKIVEKFEVHNAVKKLDDVFLIQDSG